MPNHATSGTEQGGLTPRQEQFLSALLTENSITTAAKRANCAHRTAQRWLKQPQFPEAYRQARREGVARATSRLQAVSAEAVETLRSILSQADAPAYSRVAAARVILDSALRAQELEELDVRIETLERALREREAVEEGERLR